MSHPFRLPGLALFDGLQETIDSIVTLREKADHPILKSLEECLRNSTENYVGIADDIAQAEVWIREVTDILLGAPGKDGKRNIDEYKRQMTAEKAEQQLQEYVFNLVGAKQKYSAFLQNAIDHFRTTYNSWKEYLFTCYDYHFLPNTNLDLELSHSRMKRKHRKITGLKNSHQFMLIHGEHFSFCFNFDHSVASLSDLLRSSDKEKVRDMVKAEIAKSKQRAENRLTIKDLPAMLKEITENWG